MLRVPLQCGTLERRFTTPALPEREDYVSPDSVFRNR